MQKRGFVLAGCFVLTIFLLLIVGISGVYAQETNGSTTSTTTQETTTTIDTTTETEITTPSDSETSDIPDDSSTSADEGANEEEIEQESEEERNAELSVGAGITPDSGLYFVEDQILSRFRGDSENREKKMAEIEVMIKEGKIDEARESLGRYRRYADDLEKEVDPEKRDEARRSAAAIRNTLREIKDEIPEDQRKEFVDNVLEKEKSIVTAAEIAGKIKELCESLSKLDPLQYSKICKTENDAPNWQKKLDRKLTKEQRDEAEKFGKIMSECFKTAGQECRCDEIPFTDFAEACSTAAPLATACEIKKDEKACEELDDLEMPELPPHLQDVFDALENDVSGARMDLHMPRECVEAGAKSPKECAKVMIQTNAPEECQEALLNSGCEKERECRQICEEIMFKANAPEECVEAGVKDPKECGKIMFKANAPEECVAAGLTGESRSDEKKCREIMESLGGKEGGPRGPPRGGFGPDCRSIQNAEERLKCFDGALSGVEQHFEDKRGFDERFKETKEKERQCAQSCASQNKPWDFSGGVCTCREDTGGDYQQYYNQRREEFRPPEGQEGFRPPQEGFQQPPQGFEGQQPPQGEFQRPPEGQFQQPPSGEQPPTTESGSSGATSGTTSGGESSTTSSSSSGSGGGEGTVTGGVISGNAFLDYFYK